MGFYMPERKVCLDCEHEYLYNLDTLELAKGNTGQCTKCGSKNTEYKENLSYKQK